MSGRSRGRGIANVTSSPVSSPIYPSGELCFYTEYDGIDDAYTSSDASLRIAGAQTWVVETKFPSGQSDVYAGILANNTGGTDGLTLYYAPGPNKIYWESRGAGSNLVTLTPFTENSLYNRIVGVYDGANLKMDLYNGTSWASATIACALNTSTANFNIGKVNFVTDRFLNGSIKNIEIYNAAATTPQSWVYGDATSLGLLESNLVLRNQDGTGGAGFTKSGDPITLECP